MENRVGLNLNPLLARALVGALALASLAPASLALASLASAAHEDDPKLWSLRPPHHGRPVRTSVQQGQPMASGGTPRALQSSGVMLLSQLPLTQFGANSGNDCWGYVTPLGREIAIFCHSNGAAFIDITDPSDPVVLLYGSGPQSLWRDVKVFGTYAYVVSEGGGGIQIYNLANADAGVVTLANTITTGGAATTHNVAIDTQSGFLYRCGGGNNVGLRIYNLNTNPVNPPFVGQWNSLYVHDAQIVTYTSGPYAGKQIAFACAGTGNGSGATRLSILDVTNKSSITTMREVYWPGGAYSHQCWISEDRQYCYIDDELDEPSVPSTTYVVSIGNLANATLLGNFTNGNAAVTHNLYVKGNRIFEANYRSGLRIFDRTDPVNCSEVAFFDTFPADDGAQFNGLWSVYPYFPSGVVIGSDLESGFFVWWVGQPLVDVALAQPDPGLINPGGQSFSATITGNPSSALVAGSERLFYDAGAGTVSVPLVNQGGGNYHCVFPALPCGTEVSWYIAADSTNGVTWKYPTEGASGPLRSVVAYGAGVAADLDMESAAGWTVGDAGDNATTGQWVRGDPNGTAAQPEDDHTATGNFCWFTGQALPNSTIGTADVDGGTTTLKSAVYDLTGFQDPVISYWRWYSNNQGVVDDTFTVEVTNGSGWQLVETVGPTGPQAAGGWYYHEFHVTDFFPPGPGIQLRFKASDLGQGSIVEAAIDDFRIRDVDCSAPSVYCTSGTSAVGCTASLSFAGYPSGSATSGFVISAQGVEGQRAGLLFYSVSGPNSAVWAPGSSSFLCVKAPTQRAGSQVSGGTAGACDGVYALDWNAFRAARPNALGAPFSPGTLIWSQAWYRDPSSPGTTSLSNALRFVVGP